MLKRAVVLLLFVQFSFGQENESSLELDKEGRFSFGFKYDWSGESITSSENRMLSHIYGRGFYLYDFNYLVKEKIIIGLQVGVYPKYLTSISRYEDSNSKIALRTGLVLSDKLKLILTNGIVGKTNAEIFGNGNTYKQTGPSFHSSLSFILNTGIISPEIGITYVTNQIKTNYNVNAFALSNHHFFMPSIGINLNLKPKKNKVKFSFNPSKKRAIKKLTQAKNALDMELITQEEYDKIYVKYAHFAKDKQ